MLFTAFLEFVVAGVCLWDSSGTLSLCLVAWLGMNFAAYRIGLTWVNWKRPCNCLGNLTDALHIPPATADLVMKCILTYLLVGSCACLLWRWRQRNRQATIEAGVPVAQSL
jgi:hypothetical protein